MKSRKGPYQKIPLSINDQVNKLENRGMIINDQNERDTVKTFLLNVSYYRFSGYTFSFQNRKIKSHPFNQDVDFESIKSLYYFDQELRQLLFNAISKIEIAFRSQIINQYSLVHNSHWHTDSSLFKKQSDYDSFSKNLMETCDESKYDKHSKHPFIKHYYE